MEDFNWSEIDDNDEIKEEFLGYKEGLVRYGKKGWAFAPGTSEMISQYQVKQ